jgi:hypothetical protein
MPDPVSTIAVSSVREARKASWRFCRCGERLTFNRGVCELVYGKSELDNVRH